ncbi:MAG: LLM class flavin-dependent oxidoreductase, partial [Acidimicrobiia bacterium]|nr:LLM class flavin-dependent oxidoreductase [Acidimicrobiia bacterium]
MTMDDIVARARAAEAAGFAGVAFMDHLAPPGAEDRPMFDAMATAAWVAAHTARLRIGHLVLCDAFRQPAVLAREVTTIDHASGGRFELGIGSGSVPAELARFGVSAGVRGGAQGGRAGRRVERLAETLEVLKLLWTGDPVDYDGQFHHLHGAQQLPAPTRPIRVVIGGAGPR